MRILALSEVITWWAEHSGYHLLVPALRRCGVEVQNRGTSVRAPLLLRPVLRKLARRAYCRSFYSVDHAWAEIGAIGAHAKGKYDIVHHFSSDDTFGLMRHIKRVGPTLLAGTVHQPPSIIKLDDINLQNLASLDLIFTLSRSLRDYLASLFGPDRVCYVPYGIDVEFWSPANDGKPKNPSFVFSGTWLRDFGTLADAIDIIVRKIHNAEFHLFVHSRFRRNNWDLCYRIARHKQVHWYEGASDEVLRQVYRQATALLMPLFDSSANNAILEALACGLPIISNRVGGVADYVDDQCGLFSEVCDARAMAEHAMLLVDDHEKQSAMGQACRQRAEEEFAWPLIANRMIDVYKSRIG